MHNFIRRTVFSRSSVLATMAIATLSLTVNAADLAATGIKNFHQVSDKLYRGAQPSEEGFKSLAKIGVKTIIDLRESSDRSTWEEGVVKAAGMKYIAVPMGPYQAPTNDQMTHILGIIGDQGAGPVFVHCKRGADRTGAVVACYRITHDKWANDKALDEAKSLGMNRFEFAKKRYVMAYHNPAATQPVIVPATVTVPAQ